ncbi:MAG: VanZ family protein [Candidatus Nitrospinota bacterium M3_3B_026]
MRTFRAKENAVRRRAWGALAAYALFIYVSLPFARTISEQLSERGVLTFAVYLAAAAALAAYIAFNARLLLLWRPVSLVMLACLAALFAVFMLYLDVPAERFHLVEYSVMGWLAHRAARTTFDGWRVFAAAFFVTALAGLVDEVIQLALPRRVYDWRDVFFNGAGGVFGLLFVWLADRERRRIFGEAGK